jgi:dTDP-4-dehydrorhamnose reductase
LIESRNKPVVWVTGAGGLIGSHVANCVNSPAGWRVIGLARVNLDLTCHEVVARRFREEAPTLVIHCAAVSTAVACGKNPNLARRVNVEVTRQLAELCAEARLILLSTDLVFDGRKGNYTETDSANPLNLYGETKLEAERILLANPRHLVIRTTLNAGVSPTGDRSFAEQTRAAWRRSETLRLFTDEYRNPIGADVTARAIWELAESNTSGLFHLAGGERLNRLEIGQLLAAQWPRLNCRMEPATLRDFPGPPRAADCSLDCTKAQSLLSFQLPRFSDWLPGSELARL